MIKTFAELDENGFVRRIDEYPTDDGWTASSFMIEITKDITVPRIGSLYERENDRFLKPEDEVSKDILKKIYFDPIRKKLFKDTKWVRERHQDRIELKIYDKLNWDEWLNYWQALRDLPTKETFNTANPVLPEQPK